MLKVVCCDVAIILIFILNIGANITKYFQYSKGKGQKVTLLWFSGLRQYAFGDYSTWEQGKRYGITGSEKACNRERDGILPDSDGRPHKLGRAPLYLGAPALTCWSGRSKPSFILQYYSFQGSRASGGFHVPSTDADVRPCRGCRDRLWQSRASVR